MESKEPEVSSQLPTCSLSAQIFNLFTYFPGCRGHRQAVQAPGQPLGGNREGPGERHEDTLRVAAGSHLGRYAGEFRACLYSVFFFQWPP